MGLAPRPACSRRLVAAVAACILALPAASQLGTTPDWFVEGEKTAASLGFAVAGGCDVNGDGYDDVVVGLPFWTIDTPSSPNLGRTYVYHGDAAGLSTQRAWEVEGDEDRFFENLGYSVDCAGDVNADGYDDVIIGTGENSVEPDRVWVWHGSATGLPLFTPADWMVEGPSEGFGFSIAGAGDVNGDGYDDVIVGHRRYDGDQQLEGAALVYHGSASGLSTTETWRVEGNEYRHELGYAVDGAGDVNGDGFDDVIVAARNCANQCQGAGTAYVFLGGASGLATSPVWTEQVSDPTVVDNLGAVAGAGDVNGDGFDDVILGAWSFGSRGGAFVYHGSAGGPSPEADWIVAPGDAPWWAFGIAVDGAGDVNGDGFDDVVVGDLSYSNPVFNEGAAAVYLGSAAGLAPTDAWMIESDSEGALFGHAVAGAGDTDGDGFDEVLVGAYQWWNGFVGQGAAFLYAGEPSPGAAGRIASTSAAAGSPLSVRKGTGDDLVLAWGGSCLFGDDDYAVYAGGLAELAVRSPVTCTTGGATDYAFTPLGGGRHFLVVPGNGTVEGSYGTDSRGLPRPPSDLACLPQTMAPCP